MCHFTIRRCLQNNIIHTSYVCIQYIQQFSAILQNIRMSNFHVCAKSPIQIHCTCVKIGIQILQDCCKPLYIRNELWRCLTSRLPITQGLPIYVATKTVQTWLQLCTWLWNTDIGHTQRVKNDQLRKLEKKCSVIEEPCPFRKVKFAVFLFFFKASLGV